MSERRTLARRMKRTLRSSSLALRTGAETLGYALENKLRPSHDAKVRAKLRIGRGALSSIGFDVSVRGSLPEPGEHYIVVANHRSAFDIALLLSLVPDAVLLSRGDIANWPILGWLAREGDTLFVDREDRGNGAKAIRAMRRTVAEGRHLCVFPEGTTHAEPRVRPFQLGVFAAARGLRARIVPIGIAYSEGLEWVQPSMGRYLGEALERDRLAVSVEIGEPIDTGTLRTEALASLAHDAVSELFQRATARVRR